MEATALVIVMIIPIGLLAAAGIATATVALRRSRSEVDSLNDKIAQLEQQVSMATTGAIGMGKRVLALEGQLKQLSAEQQNRSDDNEGYAYAQAMRMFDQGADVATVVSSCGLSSSEANLMALVRQQLGNPSKPAAANVR